MGYADKLCSVRSDRYREAKKSLLLRPSEDIRLVVDEYIKRRQEKRGFNNGAERE